MKFYAAAIELLSTSILEKNYFIAVLLMVFFASFPVMSQTILEKYDLNFNGIIPCNHSWVSMKNNCIFIKDGENVMRGKPAAELFYKNFKQGKTMRFKLSKTIILPRNLPQEKCEISVTSKDDVNRDFWFKVTALNTNGQEKESDSVKINSRLWEKNTVKIKHAGAKAIRVNIYYDGDSSENQHVWIDRISIKVGGKDIARSNYFSDNLKDSLKTIKSINKEHIIPFTIKNDSTLLYGIKDLPGKIIVGIGECTHGSNTIKKAEYQFLKNLIVSHHCRLVLLETSITTTLTWNLYIQGKLPKEYSQQIEADVKASFIDHELLIRFLDWLRAYNSHSISKVYISGIDNPNPEAKKLNLFNFYLTLLGKQRGAFYLRKTVDEKYDDILTRSLLDTALQNSMGKKNFECYLPVLKNEIASPQKNDAFFADRDINMSKRVFNLINIFMKPGEKTGVLAHTDHIQNLERSAGDRTLGYYLRKHYGERYFSISFQIGKGTFSQDECSPDVQTITDSLGKPPFYSFEYAGLAICIPYFYYPAKYLGDAILTYCSIPRGGRYDDLYKFSSPKKQFDAYVFIKESKPMENIEPTPFIYMGNYFYAKKRAMDSIANELKIDH